MNVVDVTKLGPLTHAAAIDLQAHELDRTLAMLRTFSPDDWAARTDCPGWDVRTMYLHVLGACAAGASMLENARQLGAAMKHRRINGGPLESALSATQIQHRIHLTPTELVTRLAVVAPKTIRGRRRTPGLIRNHAKLAVDGPVHERWSLGYLIDTIYLRDLWMHRVDASRATGTSLDLTAEHDGAIVSDVVAEWARRHGQPFRLELSGPAGGTFTATPNSPSAERYALDAIEFCRTLAGRAPAKGLLATIVPF